MSNLPASRLFRPLPPKSIEKAFEHIYEILQVLG